LTVLQLHSCKWWSNLTSSSQITKPGGAASGLKLVLLLPIPARGYGDFPALAPVATVAVIRVSELRVKPITANGTKKAISA